MLPLLVHIYLQVGCVRQMRTAFWVGYVIVDRDQDNQALGKKARAVCCSSGINTGFNNISGRYSLICVVHRMKSRLAFFLVFSLRRPFSLAMVRELPSYNPVASLVQAQYIDYLTKQLDICSAARGAD